MQKEPQPIAWESLALVGYVNNRPCILSGITPEIVVHTLSGLVQDELEMDKEDDWNDEITVDDLIHENKGIRWELHPVEVAKEIFCSRTKDPEEERPTNRPLPGQLSLPIGDE